jgi:hypothetical protein
MESYDPKNKSKEKSEKGSNSCVIDLSLDNEIGIEEIELNEKSEMDNNKITLNKSFDDIQNFKKKLNLKDNFENILDLGEEGMLSDNDDNNFGRTRSKTYKEKSYYKNSPKPKPLEIDEYIKPLRLNSHKTIIRESSQIDLIDCKSSDDKSESYQNYLNYFSKDEDTDEEIKSTLKINKINNKKEMKFFKPKINCKYYNEYENILNIEKIFFKNINSQDNILIGKNQNIQNTQKRKFWHKHISVFKKQLKLFKNTEKTKEKSEIKIKKADTFTKNNYEGLFILGVLESAAKEKKRRKTIQNSKLNKKNKNKNDEDEK